jgi:zinc protease
MQKASGYGRRIRVCVFALASVLTGAAHGATSVAADGDALRATLDNGLRVVIVRNTLAPVAATTVNYLVGADETPPGFPGTAHAQEHMMFRGHPGLSADQLADIGSRLGGNFNADTRQTVTQYLFTVPAEDIDVALHVEAIRMRGVLDAEKDWAQERGAIEQEVAQDLSDPRYVLYTELRAALFAGTPYAHDGLGTRASFDKTTGADLKKFYEAWYAPNNAILVITGDVDPEATLAKVKALFGDIPKKTLPERPSIELQSVKAQSLHLKTDLPYALHVTAFRMPGLESHDYPAAEVLADVLNSQRGALYELVVQGRALSANFSFEPLPRAGLGYVGIAFPAGADAAAVARDVHTVVAKIVKDGVPADLVAAAKLHERRDAEFQKNSVQGLASVWSEAVAVDGLRSPDEDLVRIEKVTVADVNRAARKYLDTDRVVTAILTPQRGGEPVVSKGFGGAENISLGEAKPTELPDWAAAALNRLSVPASRIDSTVSKLANGLQLIVQPEDVSDTVSVYGAVRIRPEVQVPKGKDGLSQVLEPLFSYGSKTRDRVAFQRALDAIGANEHAGSDFAVQSLTENFDGAVELLADNELHPAFPEHAFDIVKRQAIEATAGELESPGYRAGRALRVALFPKGDPVRRQALPKTIAAVTLKDVQHYYQKNFRPDVTTIVVIGRITPERARAVIEKYFGAWHASGPAPVSELPPVPPNAASTTAVPDASRVQDRVTLAQTLGLTRSNPDYYALALGNNVLGGGFYSSRLTRDLRKDAGLVYYVGSSLEVGKTRGVYFIGYACDPKNVSTVQRMIVRELEVMQKTPAAEDELRRSKAMLLRRIPLSESSTGSIARGLLERVRLDLPLDEPTRAARRYLALDADDVQHAFAKHLRPANLVRVTQGPTPD